MTPADEPPKDLSDPWACDRLTPLEHVHEAASGRPPGQSIQREGFILAKLEEDSDASRGSVSDPDLDDLGLAIPEFRVPSNASGFKADSDPDDVQAFEDATTKKHAPVDDPAPSAGIIRKAPVERERSRTRPGDSAAVAAQDAAPPSSDPPKPTEGKDDKFDRAALVQTVRMDAFDRQAVEAGASPMFDVVGVLPDQRFAPDVLVAPPRVLTKKWREGAGTNANGATGAPIPSGEPEAEPESVPQPEIPRPASHGADLSEVSEDEYSDDHTEALDLDNEIVEEVKPPPKPPAAPSDVQGESSTATPVAATPAPPPAEKQVQRPKRQMQATGPLPAQVPVEREADDDLNGIVQELLEEKKAKPPKKQKQQARPQDRRAGWTQDVFSEEYYRTITSDLERETEREVRFIHQAFNLQKGARILDLACGFGRHSIELAQRGYEMAGLDSSIAMLQKALADAQNKNLNIKFIHGDMRELGFSEVFDACMCWQTSFGYFDDRTNVAVAQGIARAVKPHGRLLLDVVNRDYVVAQMPSRTWWEGHECVFLEEVEFDHHTSVLHTKRSFIYEDGQTPPREFSSYIRLYSLHELRQLLYFAGFRVIEVSGAIHTPGSFLGPTSDRMIILAERIPPKE